MVGVILNAQTGKVGINTTAPSEILEVNGTARVRDLPIDGTTNALYNGANTKATTFTATNPVLIDINGNLGRSVNKDLVPNKNSGGFTANDASNAMFVIRRYTVKDWPTGSSGTGFDTGMSTAKWEAVMSNVSYRLSNRDITSNDSSASNTAINNFLNNLFGSEYYLGVPSKIATFGWTLGKNSGTWRVMGDFGGIVEQDTPVDILFINKNYVVTDRP